MTDDEHRAERARQVSESLHRWCKSQGVRIVAGGSGATVADGELGDLFEFSFVGWEEHAADEVTVCR